MCAMDLPNGDKYAAAEEQALAEMADDSSSEDFGTEADEVEETPSDNDAAGDPIEDEDVVSDEATEVEDQQAPTFDPSHWDGRQETLPDTLKAPVEQIRKTMERGMHAKFQELATLRKEYESKLESLRSDSNPKPVGTPGDQPPPPPDSTMTYEEQVEAQNKRDAWFVAKEMDRRFAESPQFQKVSEIAKQQEAAERLNLIRSQDGFTPEIGQAMAKIAESHPAYARLLDDTESSLVLFQMAKLAVETSALRSQTENAQQAAAATAGAAVKKKASAAQNAVSRSGGTRKATPAENFSKWGFAEAEKAAMEAWESGKTG